MEKQNEYNDGYSNNAPKTTASLAFRMSILLRALAAAACAASSWTMLTNHQSTLVFGVMPMVAKYNYVPSFKLMAYVNIVAAVLAVVSLCSLLVCRRRISSNAYFFVFIHDLVVMTLIMAGSSAATAEGNVGRHGNSHSGWMPICGYVRHFCSRSTASISLSYTAFLLFLLLTILSSSFSRNI